MKEKATNELRKVVTENYNKYLKLKMAGYCQTYYEIAVYNGLGHDFIKDLEVKYQDKFNSALDKIK